MSGELPIGKTFGNYLVHGIKEIQAPDPISWTPQAPGWMVVWGVLLMIALWALGRQFIRWRGNAYRRAALATIGKLEKEENSRYKKILSALPRIVKYTALCAYPTVEVASLSGDNWIRFLERRCADENFNRDIAGRLVTIAYQSPEKWGFGKQESEEVIELVKNWIRCHDRGIQDA